MRLDGRKNEMRENAEGERGRGREKRRDTERKIGVGCGKYPQIELVEAALH